LLLIYSSKKHKPGRKSILLDSKPENGFINSPRYFRNMEEKLFSTHTLVLNKSTANPDFFLERKSKNPAILL
jgi:hypothetical protein